MNLYTNSSGKNSFRNAFYINAHGPIDILIASPFFTYDQLISELLERSCRIKLIVRLCSATSPTALVKIIDKEGVQIRYFTSRLFHSKLYIFGDDVAIVGSANMTESGMQSNREIGVEIHREEPCFDSLISLFSSYWDQAEVLTTERLRRFKDISYGNTGTSIDDKCDNDIINEFGDVKPAEGIQVGNKKPSREKVFLESYRRTYQEFLDAYKIVERVYKLTGKRKLREDHVPLRIEIDNFFSFIREDFTTGESYLNEPFRNGSDLEQFISEKLDNWFGAKREYLEKYIPLNYSVINSLFSSVNSINKADINEIYSALDKCHAFHDRFRFYKGGAETMKQAFISDNKIEHLRNVFTYLIFGKGDFIERMGNCIFDPLYRTPHFGRSCVQELYGWVNKDNIPICNGRTVKALRFLGFNVKIFN